MLALDTLVVAAELLRLRVGAVNRAMLRYEQLEWLCEWCHLLLLFLLLLLLLLLLLQQRGGRNTHALRCLQVCTIQGEVYTSSPPLNFLLPR